MTTPVLQIIEFYKILEKLCQVKRDNLMTDGRHETDSDHMFKLCFLVMMITPYLKKKVDYAKMLELALVHDIVEAKSGDVSLSAQYDNPKVKAKKIADEKEAIEHYKKILPSPLGDNVYDLFMEYENKSTREAQIVYILDKLDAHLQANMYSDGDIRYWADCPNGHMYYEMVSGKVSRREEKWVKAVDEEILKELEDICLKISQDNMKKCGIKV